jgi:hypothetical protein
MRLFGFASLALVVAAAAPAGADEWSHRYPLKGRADLHVRTDDGSVRVESGALSEIEARVTTDGWRLAPGEVSIKESQTGDRVEIEVLLPKLRGWHWDGHRSIEVVLRVPAEADVDVHTGDGSITAGAVSGRVSLSSGDGSITADSLGGEIKLHTGDGSIRASGLSGELRADTGDGHMSIRGRFDALDLRTGDGGIEAAADAGSKVASAWSLSSGDGSVTLRLPRDLGADLDAHTGDGGIHVDSPLAVKGTVSDNSVRGQLGAGGLPLRIRTGDGSIRLSGL